MNVTIRALIIFLALLGFSANPSAAASDDDAIRELLMTSFDRPEARLAVDPVVVANDHAIADWTQSGAPRFAAASTSARRDRNVALSPDGTAADLTSVINRLGLASTDQPGPGATPWVSSISVAPGSNGHTGWLMNVSDEQVAEKQLFKLLAAEDVVVTEFGRKKYDLEEVFMGIVEGNDHGNK